MQILGPYFLSKGFAPAAGPWLTEQLNWMTGWMAGLARLAGLAGLAGGWLASLVAFGGIWDSLGPPLGQATEAVKVKSSFGGPNH